MSKLQREKLSEIFFQSRKTIPEKFSLYVPIHQKGAKQIGMQGKQWQAKVNPNTTKPMDILKDWEVDYEQYFIEAKQSLEAQLKNNVA